MIPEEFREFFVAAAGTTGALVGLLFVAVSVFPDAGREDTTRAQFHTRSSAALLVFTNALIISMAALVPDVRLGWWAIVAGAGVLVFAAATARSIVSEARALRDGPGRQLGLIGLPGLLVIGGFEVYAGIRLLAAAPELDLGAIKTLMYVLIGELMYGIARAWQLLGVRDSGLFSTLRLLAGRDPARGGE
ncbi:hypothetical protein ACTXG7_19160 [Mycolicibacterium sp. Dal123E01]|uniref:hypothetical protein n=1 Tax=Mycolicibacterium sp. Dal123E01 TaxID=3457578 RepID=UPI00403E9690